MAVSLMMTSTRQHSVLMKLKWNISHFFFIWQWLTQLISILIFLCVYSQVICVQFFWCIARISVVFIFVFVEFSGNDAISCLIAIQFNYQVFLIYSFSTWIDLCYELCKMKCNFHSWSVFFWIVKFLFFTPMICFWLFRCVEV